MKQDPEHTYSTDELTGDKILEGHEYDGIKELDNRLPKWWLGLFYITIIFSVIYFLRYHVLKTGNLQEAEYQKELADAAERMESELGCDDIGCMCETVRAALAAFRSAIEVK